LLVGARRNTFQPKCWRCRHISSWCRHISHTPECMFQAEVKVSTHSEEVSTHWSFNRKQVPRPRWRCRHIDQEVSTHCTINRRQGLQAKADGVDTYAISVDTLHMHPKACFQGILKGQHFEEKCRHIGHKCRHIGHTPESEFPGKTSRCRHIHGWCRHMLRFLRSGATSLT
jgi:hypothetical protein